jgi:hypothetical protein
MSEECKHEYFLESETRENFVDNSNDQETNMRWDDVKTFRCKFCLHKVEERKPERRYILYRSLR